MSRKLDDLSRKLEFRQPASGLRFGTGVGRGEGGLDFGGSIAVDDEGYIYVADVDQRIQKFAP